MNDFDDRIRESLHRVDGWSPDVSGARGRFATARSRRAHRRQVAVAGFAVVAIAGSATWALPDAAPQRIGVSPLTPPSERTGADYFVDFRGGGGCVDADRPLMVLDETYDGEQVTVAVGQHVVIMSRDEVASERRREPAVADPRILRYQCTAFMVATPESRDMDFVYVATLLQPQRVGRTEASVPALDGCDAPACEAFTITFDVQPAAPNASVPPFVPDPDPSASPTKPPSGEVETVYPMCPEHQKEFDLSDNGARVELRIGDVIQLHFDETKDVRWTDPASADDSVIADTCGQIMTDGYRDEFWTRWKFVAKSVGTTEIRGKREDCADCPPFVFHVEVKP